MSICLSHSVSVSVSVCLSVCLYSPCLELPTLRGTSAHGRDIFSCSPTTHKYQSTRNKESRRFKTQISGPRGRRLESLMILTMPRSPSHSLPSPPPPPPISLSPPPLQSPTLARLSLSHSLPPPPPPTRIHTVSLTVPLVIREEEGEGGRKKEEKTNEQKNSMHFCLFTSISDNLSP